MYCRELVPMSPLCLDWVESRVLLPICTLTNLLSDTPTNLYPHIHSLH